MIESLSIDDVYAYAVGFRVLDDRVRLWDIPKRTTSGSAGVDLRAMLHLNMPQVSEIPSVEDDGEPNYALNIHPGQTIVIPTGIAVWINNSLWAGLIMARSGLSTNKGLAPANKVGLIDSDYQGPLQVALHNSGNRVQTVELGERIAQLVIVPIIPATFVEVDSFEHETVRAEGGFGSTGSH